MPRKDKPVTQMTDKELVRKLFPKPVRKALKEALLEMKRAKPRGRKSKKT
jgi:hypothetical protein